MRLHPSVVLFSFIVFAYCAQVNITVDDTYGDSRTGAEITYYPADAWQAGQNCKNCTALVDGTQAYDSSWHDATFNPVGGQSNSFPGTVVSASYSFNGTGVYVYCILTRSESSPDGNTDLTFLVDGNSAGSFTQSANGDTAYEYNQVVFAISGLSQAQHNLTIQSGNAGAKALVLLDRIVYTSDEDDVTSTLAQTSSTTSTTSIPSSSVESSSLLSTTSSKSSTAAAATSSSSESQGSSIYPLSPFAASSTSSSTPSSPASASAGFSSNPKRNIITGAVVGSISATILLSLVWWLLRRRRRSNDESSVEQAIQPFFSRSHTGGHMVNYSGGVTSPAVLNMPNISSEPSPTTSAWGWSPALAASPETPIFGGRRRFFAGLNVIPERSAETLAGPSIPPERSPALAVPIPATATYGKPSKGYKVSPFMPTQLYSSTNGAPPSTISGSNGSANEVDLHSHTTLLRPNRKPEVPRNTEQDSESRLKWQHKVAHVFTPSTHRLSLFGHSLHGHPNMSTLGGPLAQASPPPPYHPPHYGRNL